MGQVDINQTDRVSQVPKLDKPTRLKSELFLVLGDAIASKIQTNMISKGGPAPLQCAVGYFSTKLALN